MKIYRKPLLALILSAAAFGAAAAPALATTLEPGTTQAASISQSMWPGTAPRLNGTEPRNPINPLPLQDILELIFGPFKKKG